jgi:hypothetical protein
MSYTKTTRNGVCLAVGGICLIWGTTAPAATVRAITKVAEKQPVVASQKIHRVTHVIQSFSSQTLNLASGKKYDLKNVQITDLSGKDKGAKIAEMTFVDKKLKDVVIRKIKP